jgi:hypothetical protein
VKDKNHEWHLSLANVFKKIFSGNNFENYKSLYSVELEAIMNLIPGCEYLGMMPFARATVIEKASKV